MSIAKGNKVEGDIVKIFGLKNCHYLNIEMSANSFVEVTAKFYPEIEDMERIKEIIIKYDLVEKEKKEIKND